MERARALRASPQVVPSEPRGLAAQPKHLLGELSQCALGTSGIGCLDQPTWHHAAAGAVRHAHEQRRWSLMSH